VIKGLADVALDVMCEPNSRWRCISTAKGEALLRLAAESKFVEVIDLCDTTGIDGDLVAQLLEISHVRGRRHCEPLARQPKAGVHGQALDSCISVCRQRVGGAAIEGRCATNSYPREKKKRDSKKKSTNHTILMYNLQFY
jgi:hypothetical protein